MKMTCKFCGRGSVCPPQLNACSIPFAPGPPLAVLEHCHPVHLIPLSTTQWALLLNG